MATTVIQNWQRQGILKGKSQVHEKVYSTITLRVRVLYESIGSLGKSVFENLLNELNPTTTDLGKQDT